LAENENLSAKIEIGVEIDQASLKKAQADIEALGAASKAISTEIAYGSSSRPANRNITENKKLDLIAKNNGRVAEALNVLVNGTNEAAVELGNLKKKLKAINLSILTDPETGQNNLVRAVKQPTMFIAGNMKTSVKGSEKNLVTRGFNREFAGTEQFVPISPAESKKIVDALFNSFSKQTTPQTVKTIENLTGKAFTAGSMLDILASGVAETTSSLHDLKRKIDKAGYVFEIDAKNSLVGLKPKTISSQYEASTKLREQNYYGGDRYIPLGALSPSGQDTAAINKGVLEALGKRGFEGMGNFKVGGISTAEEILNNGDSNVYVPELEQWAKDLKDETFRLEAQWLNAEAQRWAKLLGIGFAPDAVALSGEKNDFKMFPKVNEHLKTGAHLGRTARGDDGSLQDIRKLLADYIPGADGTPIINPQVFLMAVQDAMKNMPVAAGRSSVAESVKEDLQKEIEDGLKNILGINFADISNAIDATFKEYDWNKSITDAARKKKQAEAQAVANEEYAAGQQMGLAVHGMTGQELSKGEILKHQIKEQLKQSGEKNPDQKLNQILEAAYGPYIEKIFKNIERQAYLKGEKAISNYMSNYGELSIGDGSLDNMQEYVDRNVITEIAGYERPYSSLQDKSYGLKPGAFAANYKGVIGESLIGQTAWQTNAAGLPQTAPRPFGPRNSILADGMNDEKFLRSVMSQLKQVGASGIIGQATNGITIQAKEMEQASIGVSEALNSVVVKTQKDLDKLKKLLTEFAGKDGINSDVFDRERATINFHKKALKNANTPSRANEAIAYAKQDIPDLYRALAREKEQLKLAQNNNKSVIGSAIDPNNTGANTTVADAMAATKARREAVLAAVAERKQAAQAKADEEALAAATRSKALTLYNPNSAIGQRPAIQIPDDSAIIAQAKAEAKAKEAARLAAAAQVKAAAEAARIAQTPSAAIPVRSASELGNPAVDALRKAYNDPEFKNLEKIMGKETYDKIFTFVGEAAKDGLNKVTAGWDTEHADKLKHAGVPTITESSVMLRNTGGKMVDVQTFMHRPAYLAEGGIGERGMNNALSIPAVAGKKTAAGLITTIAAFEKRAADLGLSSKDMGDLHDAEANKAEAEKKLGALLAIFKLLDKLNIPLAGHNVLDADFGQLSQSVTMLQKQGSHLRTTQGLSNIVDNNKILQSMQSSQAASDPGVVFSQANKGQLSQGDVLKKLFTDFKEATKPYADMVKFGKEGFTITVDGKDFAAHSAKGDATASIIVTEVMRKISPVFKELMDSPNYDWVKGNSKYKKTMPYNNERPNAAKFDMQSRSLAADIAMQQNEVDANGGASTASQAKVKQAYLQHILGLYEKIRDVNGNSFKYSEAENIALKASLDLLFKHSAERKTILDAQKSKTVSEVAELTRVNNLLNLEVQLKKEVAERNGNILKSSTTLHLINRTISADYAAAVRREEEILKLKKQQGQVAPDRYHDTISAMLGRPKLTVSNSDEKISNPIVNEQAGSVFGSQIKAQMKEYVAREKEVESANKNLINTWVTARYALYDVGNAFQNVSQRLFTFGRQIFNLTDSYRSFETAFMPVDRAMSLMKDETQGVLDQFIKLSEQIPVTVEDLSRIATLGAQMGVGASGIVQFTQTVAEFTSITGMSADVVAEKFGRIAQLTKLDYSKLANLGSSIAYAGVNAVATEPEILSLSEAIAAVSERVGVLPEQVIGLSTSLASLGVPAEQARGVFTRLFGKIDRVVADGGPALQKFAKTAGVSAETFAAKWGEAGKSYDLLRGILGGVNTSGKQLTAVFDSLGITETREVNTLTRMAKNLDVVDKSMSDATKAFESNIFLQEAFAKTADTVDSKIKIFQNSLNSFGAEVGKTLAGSFKAVLEVMTTFMQGLKAMAQDPAMQVMAMSLAGLATFGAAAAGTVSVLSKITAQIYAFRVAMINTANDPTAVKGIRRQMQSLLNYNTELIEMRDQLVNPKAGTRGQITPVVYGLGVKGNSGRSAELLKDANIYRATGEQIQQSIDKIAVSEGNLNKVRKFSSLTGQQQLTFAAKEADAVNNIVRLRAQQVTQFEEEIAQKLAAGKMSQADASAAIASARSRQILVTVINGEIRALTQEEILMARGIGLSSEVTAEKQAEAAARVKNATAIDLETKAGAIGGKGALGGIGSTLMGIAGWASIIVPVAMGIWGMVDAMAAANEEAKKFDILGSGGGLASLRDAIGKDTVEYNKSGKTIGLVKVKYDDYTATLNKSAKAVQQATGVTIAANSSTASLTSTVKTQTMALGENSKAWLANALATNEKVKGIFDENPTLIADLKKQGIDFAQILDNMLNPDIKNPGKSIDDAIAKIKTKMSKVEMVSLPDGSQMRDPFTYGLLEADLNKLESLKGIIIGIGSAISSATGQSAFQDIINGLLGIDSTATSANKSLQGVAKTIKTARDWASDVAGVWSEAFANRFGRQQGLDTINKQWIDMRKSAADAKKAIVDAKKAIDDARNSILQIRADKGVLEMQLEVAIRYGDTVRADALRAQLAEKDKAIADAQATIDAQTEAVKQAQQVASKKLTGNSAAAIDNRSQILGMVQGYDPYIQAILATSKNSVEAKKRVKELKAEFTKNATALGFDPKELETYTKHFDDMVTVMDGLPRDVTLEFTGDPALAAIKAFVAKANAEFAKMDTSPADPTKTSYKKTVKEQAAGQIADYEAQRDATKTYLASIVGNSLDAQKDRAATKSKYDALVRTVRSLKDIYNRTYNPSRPVFAAGGFVNGPGTGTSDSITARLSNGEYVIKAQSVSRYGLDFMNSLNQQRVGYAQPTQQYAASSNNDSQMVYLSPDDRALLRAAIDRPVNLYTENTKIAQSANAGNVILAQRGAN
jgi:TP901 family phage tail tape measure protein